MAKSLGLAIGQWRLDEMGSKAPEDAKAAITTASDVDFFKTSPCILCVLMGRNMPASGYHGPEHARFRLSWAGACPTLVDYVLTDSTLD